MYFIGKQCFWFSMENKSNYDICSFTLTNTSNFAAILNILFVFKKDLLNQFISMGSDDRHCFCFFLSCRSLVDDEPFFSQWLIANLWDKFISICGNSLLIMAHLFYIFIVSYLTVIHFFTHLLCEIYCSWYAKLSSVEEDFDRQWKYSNLCSKQTWVERRKKFQQICSELIQFNRFFWLIHIYTKKICPVDQQISWTYKNKIWHSSVIKYYWSWS